VDFPVDHAITLHNLHWLLNAATIYGDLLESAFDLYRIELYKAMRWPLPRSPEEKRQLGTKLSNYLRKRTEISIAFQVSGNSTD
jgi:hypothetical protein